VRQHSIRKTHHERQCHIEPCHIGGSELADPLPDPLPADRDRFVGHYLRSDPEPRFRRGLYRDAEIRLRQFGVIGQITIEAWLSGMAFDRR
jgi:hypothetical protein